MSEPSAWRTVSATFHLTHACNLRCTYCYTGEKHGIGMTQATAQRAVEFVHELASKENARHLEIVFFGGEPLLKHSLLCEIADQARREAPQGTRVTFKMSTNGLLASQAVVDSLAARGIFVSLSLDGPPGTQDDQRPDALGRGNSGKMAEIIPRLLAWNPHTAVNCVVTPQHAGALDVNIPWIFAQGFSYVSTALDWSAPWTRSELNRLGAAYQRLADWYVRETLRGRRFYLSCFDEKIRSRTRGPLDRAERCGPGVHQISIAPSGRLYPCVQFVKEDDNPAWCIGHVETGLDASRRDSLFSCTETPREECDGCDLHARCASWCACMNWASHGRLDEASPLVCEHERLLAPIADRAANCLWKRRDPLFLHKHYNPAFPVLSHLETSLSALP